MTMEWAQEGEKLNENPPHNHTKGNLRRKMKARWMKKITRIKIFVI